MTNTPSSIILFHPSGAPADKLVLGAPLYGRGFTLADEKDNGIFCPALGPIPSGPFADTPGIWSYQELFDALYNPDIPHLPGATPSQWLIEEDDCYKTPYMTNGPYWFSFETEPSIGLKAKLANHYGLAGMMVFSLDMDDFSAEYTAKTYPLLRALNDALASGEAFDPEATPCFGDANVCPLI